MNTHLSSWEKWLSTSTYLSYICSCDIQLNRNNNVGHSSQGIIHVWNWVACIIQNCEGIWFMTSESLKIEQKIMRLE